MFDERSGPKYITIGQSLAAETEEAVAEALAPVDRAATRFVLVFAPARLDLDLLTASLRDQLAGIPAFGCTTAGQITSAGYDTDSLLIVAFPKAHFRCASVLLDPLRPFSISDVAERVEAQAKAFRYRAGWSRLAMLFVDGVSKQEDLLASTLDAALQGVPVFGGSAGDGLAFSRTFVLHQDHFHANAAVLLLLDTDLPFTGLNIDHFLPTDQQLVITCTKPEDRLVHEINGAPAAEEYARMINCPVGDLCPKVFAENPMLVRHKSNHYVRAVADVTEGGALSFLAAIDDGLIMTLGRGKDVVETLETGLNVRDMAGRAADFTLGFDCILRKLEIEQKGLSNHVSEVFRNWRVIGFNTYGEQHCGVHMNQTFVGVSFFEPERGALP